MTTPAEKQPHSNEIVPFGEKGRQVDIRRRGHRKAITPIFDLVRRTHRKEKQEEELKILTKQVATKLLEGISEKGMVSLFHDKETGNFDTALFTTYFTSPTLPHLRVTLWKHDIRPDEKALETEKRFFGVVGNKLSIQATESVPSEGRRAIDIQQRWDMKEDECELVYRRNATDEATNMPIPRSNGEKIKFLREILATEVDEVATEKHFGRPYSKGDIRTSNMPDASTTHIAYWVRDVRDQLPALTHGSVKPLSE